MSTRTLFFTGTSVFAAGSGSYGKVQVSSGTTTCAASFTIINNGSFTNNGTFNNGNQTVTFGTGGNIAGTGNITFFNVPCRHAVIAE